MTDPAHAVRARSPRKLDTLPDGPGVYLWKDADGTVLYVGKAKRLRGRVRSYFAGDHADEPQAAPAACATSPTSRRSSCRDEAQSLLLENNLIKEYQPRFNVRLKDDKSYPSIAVTLGEPFPRVLVTRRRDIPGARYFGPYTDVTLLRRTLAHHPADVHRAELRATTCRGSGASAPASTITSAAAGRRASGWQDRGVDYRAMIEEVLDFLEGRTRGRAVQGARPDDARPATGEDYERARELRDTLQWLERADDAGGGRGRSAPATPT